MIAFLLAPLALQTAGASIIELPDPSAERIAIQAVVRLPPLDPRSRASADLLARSLEWHNGLFSREEMIQLCSPDFRPRTWVTPDHLGVALSVPTRDVGLGVRMLAGILTDPRFDDERFAAAKLSLRSRTTSTWRRSLDDQPRNWDLAHPQDMRDFYVAAVRPANITIAVAGNFAAGSARKAWSEAVATWQQPRVPRLRMGWDGQAFGSHGPTILSLRGAEWTVRDADLPLKLLALVALGSGKGSSLYRIAREAHGWSYRQEAVMWPTAAGWQPRLMLAAAPIGREGASSFEPDPALAHGSARTEIGAPAGLAAALKAALAQDVETWDEDTLKRAKGYAAAIVGSGADMSPLYFWPSRPPADTLEDRAFLSGYWHMKTGSLWNPDEVRAAFWNAELEALKGAARGILNGASPAVTGAGQGV